MLPQGQNDKKTEENLYIIIVGKKFEINFFGNRRRYQISEDFAAGSLDRIPFRYVFVMSDISTDPIAFFYEQGVASIVSLEYKNILQKTLD